MCVYMYIYIHTYSYFFLLDYTDVSDYTTTIQYWKCNTMIFFPFDTLKQKEFFAHHLVCDVSRKDL